MGTPTVNKGYTLPTVGGDTGPLFAQEINGDFAIVDLNMGGVNSLNVGGSANVTLSSGQAQNLVQQFAGALTGNITVFLPAVGSFYAIENATTGAFTLSVGCTGGGNTQLIPQGLNTWVWTDGSLTRLSNPPGWQEITTYQVSAVAAQTVALPGPFRRFRVSFQNVTFSTAGAILWMPTSQNGGSSLLANYVWNVWAVRGNLSTAAAANTGGSSEAVRLTGASSTTNVWDGTVEIWPGSAAKAFVARGNSYGVDNTPTWVMTQFAAAATIGGAINAVQFLASTGTWSGTLILEGLP